MRTLAALVVVALMSTVAAADGAFVVLVDRTLDSDKIATVTNALVDSLDDFDRHDEISIVSYGTSATIDLGLTSVKQRNRVSSAVANIRTAKRSDFAAGLRTAGNLLAKSKRLNKRILVVTDLGATGAYEPVLAKLRKQNILVSALGYQNGSRAALDTIASAGGGRAYPIRRGTDIAGAIRGAAETVPTSFDTLAVVLVIDRSGSMQGAKLEAAKESARVTVEVLGPDDTIAIVAFDTESQVYVRPQKAANKMRISSEIGRLQTGGGTNIYTGLKEAFDLLKDIKATQKHVIVLSDGEAPVDGIPELVDDMRDAQMTVSAVGLQGADRNLLSTIASGGNGRLYMVDDIGSLPRVFMKEVAP